MGVHIEPLPPPAPNLDEEIFRRLRQLIIAGDLVPGALYSMNELAGQLRVSRTPVAQAVARLVAQGMVRVEHRRGLRVLETSVHDLAEIYELRLLLEPRATYRAAGLMRRADKQRLKEALVALGQVAGVGENPRGYLRRDAEFHSIILHSSGNHRLAEFVQSLRDLQMLRGASTVDRSRPMADVVDDHRRIYDLVIKGDADGAAAAMHEHIAVTCNLLIEQETGQGAGNVAPPWPSPVNAELT